MTIRIAPTVFRWLIMGGTGLAVVIFGFVSLYFALRFAIWWPTVFGIDGAWRGFLALCTALPLVVWLRSYEWPEFTKKATDFVNRILWRI